MPGGGLVACAADPVVNTMSPEHRERSKMDSHRPLDGFDMGTPKKAARVGNELINELEQIAEQYPDANAARDEANGDIAVFLDRADFSDERKADRATSERIRWVFAAFEAWTDHVAETGMISNTEVQTVLDRINLDSR